ncbi:MAG TPA: hypothetical protein DEF51_16430 [Myxococcales bacterium]|nr:hypothetical protein [Myxococcales bacterium]
MKPLALMPLVLTLVSACDGGTLSADAGMLGPIEGLHGPPGTAVSWLDEDEQELFARGASRAARVWTPAEGLGPVFNTTSCLACHERPAVGGDASPHRDTYLIRQTTRGGAQVRLGVNGVQQHYSLDPASPYSTTPNATDLMARRNPGSLYGLGALTEVSTEELLSRADPSDLDGDGISGRANVAFGRTGRFGFKAQAASAEAIVRGQLFEHLGLTSRPLPEELRARLPRGAVVRTRSVPGRAVMAQAIDPDAPTADADSVDDPELGDQELFEIMAWTLGLAVPERAPADALSRRGEAAFSSLGCVDCHTPALAGPRGLVPAYSDLLLHDMGEALADGIEFALAEGTEFRTAPLWAAGAGGPYLHDGRAATLEEAILLHGGEATRARDAFESLAPSERMDVLAFLRTLGGEFEAPGLLGPDAPVPSAGTLGAPRDGVADDEFRQQRARFDDYWTPAEGVGPLLDAASCSSCHSAGSVGGAGRRDTNVIWQLSESSSGVLRPLESLVVSKRGGPTRPEPSPSAEAFIAVQAPALFGLRELASVPVTALAALADPADADGDGISGRLPNDRFGVFGTFGSVSEAIAACAGRYMGLTTESNEDDDDVADPELSEGVLSQLASFVEALAPPSPSVDLSGLAMATALFESVGCAACHVPELEGTAGPVRAYTDLLLHDVGTTRLAVDGQPGEIRTPPLWGISASAPYLHDGRAVSLEAAIAAHAGEATETTSAYLALSEDERALVITLLRSL